MAVYIVNYDLNKETSRPPIVKKIKDTYPTWAKLSESSYAISTYSDVNDVFSTLKPLIDSNDNLYIITLKKPWDGYGPKDVNDWLNRELTYC